MHISYKILASWVVAGGLLQAGESQPLNEALLARLRAEASQAHPSVLAARERAKAAEHDVSAVRLWDDPMVDLSFMAAAKMMREVDGDTMVGFEQALPKPGMFAAEKRKMEAMHRAEVENAGNSALLVGADAARAAIELALIDESIALQKKEIEWMTAMVENAHQMAVDPMGSSADALRMETELARERQMLDAAGRTRESYAQKLNLILGRPLDAPWLILQLPTQPLPVPVGVAEVARIARNNPKMRAMREMVSAANADVRIADRERLPEVSVGVDTQLYSGTGDIRSTIVGVKVSLPWFHEGIYQAKIDAAKSREVAAERDVETMRRELASMVLSASNEAANAAAEARAYGGEILSKAEQARKTIEASWISSKAPLNDLLDISRSLFAIRLEQRRMVAMQLSALEELQTLVPNR